MDHPRIQYFTYSRNSIVSRHYGILVETSDLALQERRARNKTCSLVILAKCDDRKRGFVRCWLVDHLYASAEKANEVALKAKDATIETIAAQRDNYKKQLDDAGLALPSSVKGGGRKVITTDLSDRLDVGKNAVVLGKFTGSIAEGAVVLNPDGTNQFGDPNTLAIGLGAEANRLLKYARLFNFHADHEFCLQIFA